MTPVAYLRFALMHTVADSVWLLVQLRQRDRAQIEAKRIRGRLAELRLAEINEVGVNVS